MLKAKYNYKVHNISMVMINCASETGLSLNRLIEIQCASLIRNINLRLWCTTSVKQLTMVSISRWTVRTWSKYLQFEIINVSYTFMAVFSLGYHLGPLLHNIIDTGVHMHNGNFIGVTTVKQYIGPAVQIDISRVSTNLINNLCIHVDIIHRQ